MAQFRKKPVVVEAVQWTGLNVDTVLRFLCTVASVRRKDVASLGGTFVGGGLVIETLEGEMTATPGDWIIRGVKGEFYPCKPDIFEATYEPVEAQHG